MWNPHGFHVIDRLPTGVKINSTYYFINILQPLRQTFFSQGRNPHGKPLVVHVELLGSQQRDHIIVHENSGHGFDATSTIFTEPGA
jgi:hypothetical protein